MYTGELSTQACTFETCFTLENLLVAATECQRSSRWKRQVQAFMARRLTNCRQLQRELFAGTYMPSPADRFRIMERGKPREVKSIKFRDRVVQRCLCDQVLIPALGVAMPLESSACLPGRGLTYAYRDVRRLLGDAPAGAWVLQYDFAGYFASIDHEKLLETMRPLIPDGRLFSLFARIVAEEDAGLELGSHVSQLCAAYFPAPLDVAMRCAPGCIGYHRYMDDGLAVFVSREHAKAGMRILRAAAAECGLVLNEKKTHLNRITQPFAFCKMRFQKKPGRVKMNVVKKQSRRSKHHWAHVQHRAQTHEIDLEPVRASLTGCLNRADADLTRLIN